MGWPIWLRRRFRGFVRGCTSWRPGVAEYERLQAAYAALEGSGADPGDGRPARAGSRAPGGLSGAGFTLQE